jgi:hypothetical protein
MRFDYEMARVLRILGVIACLAAVARPMSAGAEVTLFRLFLLDGSTLTSYGEFARVEDNVIFSMPVGGRPEEPRIQVTTVKASLVDWPRTDRYSASARYQRYAESRGEEDFRILSNEVALALNDIALSPNRQQALALAEGVRRTVADWPRMHYGYRQSDVREILSVLDQAISALRAAQGATAFELSLVAMADSPELEPVAGMPNARQQLDEMFHVASLTKGAERVAVLQSALALISEAGPTLSDASALRRTAETEIRQELATDRKYASLTQKVVTQAKTYAARAGISEIQRLITRVPKEDAKLGNQRPEMVQSLNTTLQSQLFAARRLRLQRDQWLLRQSAYREYQRSVGSSLLLLVKSQGSLESIRTLEGPPPDRLLALRQQLSGGAERLQRLRTPEYLRSTHELLVGAWRFAENATRARYEAIEGANAAAAWEASSAAAGAMMMLGRVQQEIRSLLEPPRLQ